MDPRNTLDRLTDNGPELTRERCANLALAERQITDEQRNAADEILSAAPALSLAE